MSAKQSSGFLKSKLHNTCLQNYHPGWPNFVNLHFVSCRGVSVLNRSILRFNFFAQVKYFSNKTLLTMHVQLSQYKFKIFYLKSIFSIQIQHPHTILAITMWKLHSVYTRAATGMKNCSRELGHPFPFPFPVQF